MTLARKDFFVRYRRASFGVLWAVALPGVQALVLGVVLSKVARISVPHYSAFIFAGIVGWTFFSASLAAGATSIVDNSALSSRIYFPRAVLPVAACLSNVFALLASTCVLIIVATIEGATAGLHTLFLVPACLLLFSVTAAMSLVLSALHVYFRDVKYAVQAGLLVWFYLTPVFYPISLLHGPTRLLVEINPITSATELFQLGAIGGRAVDSVSVIAGLAWTVGLAVAALVLHCRHDRLFADLL